MRSVVCPICFWNKPLSATIFGDIAPGIASLEASCDKTRALKRDIMKKRMASRGPYIIE
jgi:hypothetical protein